MDFANFTFFVPPLSEVQDIVLVPFSYLLVYLEHRLGS